LADFFILSIRTPAGILSLDSTMVPSHTSGLVFFDVDDRVVQVIYPIPFRGLFPPAVIFYRPGDQRQVTCRLHAVFGRRGHRLEEREMIIPE